MALALAANQGRFDFVYVFVLHGRRAVEASPRQHPLRSEFLAAPRADDQIGLPRDYLLSRHNAVLGGASTSPVRELAARRLHPRRHRAGLLAERLLLADEFVRRGAIPGV